jgi:transposase
LHGGPFGQLRQFLTYSAKLAGVADIGVDPRNTSRCYRECGFFDKANRKTQQTFSCTSFGYTRRPILQPPGTSEWRGCL